MLSLGNCTKIDQTNKIINTLMELYQATWSSDLTLIVGERHFKAHRSFLAVRSPVLSSMLYGHNFKESREETITLPDKQPESFEVFLSYLYTFSIEMSKLDLQTALEVLMLAHEYQVADLQSAMVECLGNIIDKHTVCPIFDCALLLDEKRLIGFARDFLSEHAVDIIETPGWLELSKEAVIDIIRDDLFDAAEIAILQAVVEWCRHNCLVDAKEMLGHIRFPFVSLDGIKLAQVARICRVLFENGIEAEELELLESSDSSTRHFSPRKTKALPEIPQHNMIRPGEDIILDGPSTAIAIGAIFNGKRGWDGFMDFGTPIVVKLSKVIRVDSLRFNIYAGKEQGNRSVFYRVDVSVDGARWECLADCDNYECFFGQIFIFRARNLRCVKITAFRIPGYEGPEKYAVEKLQCPVEMLEQKVRDRYQEMCPSGKETMLYQPHEETFRIFK